MSKINRENSEMSSEADIAFMESACARIVRASGVSSRQEQVSVVMRALKVTANRAYEFLTGKARRVDGFEKDLAREVVKQIEAENELRENAAFERRLQSTLAHLKETDPDFYRADIAGLERALLRGGEVDSTVDHRGD